MWGSSGIRCRPCYLSQYTTPFGPVWGPLHGCRPLCASRDLKYWWQLICWSVIPEIIPIPPTLKTQQQESRHTFKEVKKEDASRRKHDWCTMVNVSSRHITSTIPACLLLPLCPMQVLQGAPQLCILYMYCSLQAVYTQLHSRWSAV